MPRSKTCSASSQFPLPLTQQCILGRVTQNLSFFQLLFYLLCPFGLNGRFWPKRPYGLGGDVLGFRQPVFNKAQNGKTLALRSCSNISVNQMLTAYYSRNSHVVQNVYQFRCLISVLREFVCLW
ncbi:hypothetical protein Droror1_Dr00001588 [Drosera rotundifolia]